MMYLLRGRNNPNLMKAVLRMHGMVSDMLHIWNVIVACKMFRCTSESVGPEASRVESEETRMLQKEQELLRREEEVVKKEDKLRKEVDELIQKHEDLVKKEEQLAKTNEEHVCKEKAYNNIQRELDIAEQKLTLPEILIHYADIWIYY